jgi:hypothetical protein
VFWKLDRTAVIYPACNELLALTLMTFARKHLIITTAYTSAITVTRFDLRRSDQFTSTRFQCNLRRTPFLSSSFKQILMTILLPTDIHSPLLTLPILFLPVLLLRQRLPHSYNAFVSDFQSNYFCGQFFFQ